MHLELSLSRGLALCFSQTLAVCAGYDMVSRAYLPSRLHSIVYKHGSQRIAYGLGFRTSRLVKRG